MLDHRLSHASRVSLISSHTSRCEYNASVATACASPLCCPTPVVRLHNRLRPVEIFLNFGSVVGLVPCVPCDSFSSRTSVIMVRLPRESLLFSSPNHLCLVDVAHPKPSAPVVSLKPSSSTPPPAQCLSVVPPDPSSGSQGLAAWVDGPKRNVIYVSPLSTPTSSSSSSKQASPTATRWHPPQPVSSLLLSPDGRLLLAGCDDGRAYLWEVSSGLLRATWEPHFRAVSAIAWSADGGMVATGSEDGRVCVWSIVG